MRKRAAPKCLYAQRRQQVTLPVRTDEELMSQLRDGDSAALAELVRIYQNDIFRFCVHYVKDVELAREMAQETFIRVYVARGRFDSARKFRPWLLVHRA